MKRFLALLFIGIIFFAGVDNLMALTKSVDKSTPKEGDTVIYFVQIGTSESARENLFVRDILPAGVTFVSSVVSQGLFDSGTGIWTVGDLDANKAALLAITVTIDMGVAGSTIVNKATIVDAYGIDCYGSNDPYDNDNCFDNAIINVQYPCVFSNVCVSDQLPIGLNFVSASATIGHYDPYSGSWLVGDLGAGQSAVLTLTGQVDASFANVLGNTTLTNCATIKDPYNFDLYSSNNMACASVEIIGQNFVPAGSFLFWEIEVDTDDVCATNVR